MNWKCQNQSRKKAEVDDENEDIRTLDNNLVGLAQSLGAGQIICLQSTLRSDYLSSLPGAEEFSGLGCRPRYPRENSDRCSNPDDHPGQTLHMDSGQPSFENKDLCNNMET